VLVAVIFVSGSRLWPKTLLPLGSKAIEAEAGRRPVEDVVREMVASRAVVWFVFMATIFVLIILDMVLKPFLAADRDGRLRWARDAFGPLY
jgi:hypothetical protein